MIDNGLGGPTLHLDYEVRVMRVDDHRARVEWRVVPGAWQLAGIYDCADPKQMELTVVCPASIELGKAWRVTG